MNAEVYFEESEDSYQFSKTKDGDEAFVIKKDDLIFETKTFYEYFFKGLAERPQYTVVDLHENEPDHKLAGQAKHVFTTVAQVLNKTCDGIADDWFNEEDGQDADAPSSTTSGASAPEDE
jgi:hypothetical protein